jgi:hypothetical protein
MVVLPWTIIASDDDAELTGETLAVMPRKLAEGGTSISSALLYSAAHLSRAPRAQRLVIDVSSDGRNNVGVPLPCSTASWSLSPSWPHPRWVPHLILFNSSWRLTESSSSHQRLRPMATPSAQTVKSPSASLGQGENAAATFGCAPRELRPRHDDPASLPLAAPSEITFGAGRLADLLARSRHSGEAPRALPADPYSCTFALPAAGVENRRDQV